ncbi:hypothetical protein MKX42_06185 [Paenibacillus sp. FSL R7-0204]|uniref:hypothetical protein n=1 Tax=Paenibacillus sp. FSL R7-0204 TaxID=2921675 RepID=UPI0030FB452A
MKAEGALAWVFLALAIVFELSGAGILLISLAGALLFEERLSGPSLLWVTVIVAGIVGLNISAKGH